MFRVALLLIGAFISLAHGQSLCNPNICVNGGVCVLILGNPSCACPAGFSGNLCQIEVATTQAPSSICESNPCQNGGLCFTTAGSPDKFICICSNMYSGEFCQTMVGTSAPATNMPPASSICALKPCLNGGSCVPSNGSFVCICPTAFEGAVCQLAAGSVSTSAPKVCADSTSKNQIGCNPAEVVFLIEIAQTDDRFEIDHEGDFIKLLVDRWSVSDGDVRFGVVVYHDTVTETIHIDDYARNPNSLKNAITRLTRFVRGSGVADLAKALDFVRTNSFNGSRPGVEKVVIPIVHQMEPALQGNIPAAAQRLKDECVTVMAIGVRGRTLNESVIVEAVNQPYRDYYQFFNTFGTMEYGGRYFGTGRC